MGLFLDLRAAQNSKSFKIHAMYHFVSISRPPLLSQPTNYTNSRPIANAVIYFRREVYDKMGQKRSACQTAKNWKSTEKLIEIPLNAIV